MASEIKVDTISEKTSANGVTIDGVSLKDSKIATANSVDSDAYVDGSIDTVHIDALQVTGAKLNTDVISAQTELAAEPADTDEFMVSDAGVLKRIDYSLIKASNTPSFHAYLSVQQDASSTPYSAKCTFDTESWDTDGCYDNTTNYRFTPTTAGKYFIYTQIGLWTSDDDNCDYAGLEIQKNGTGVSSVSIDFRSQNIGYGQFLYGAVCVDMNGSSDYVEAVGTVAWTTGTAEFKEGLRYTFFGGFKLI